MENSGGAILDWSVATQPLAGETESGDDAVIALLDDGALVAAVDGLGHGSAAARAATVATELLREHAEEPLASLLARCHEALRPTRGAAMSAARFCVADDTMTWLGVGNVEGRLLRTGTERPSSETLVPVAGAAGVTVRQVRATTVGVDPGDALVLATDGIDPAFADSLRVAASAKEMARAILEGHAKENDDALVVVARYLGAAS
jgi:negative regulator of sigma-B (phosphoserine phosphatase)